MDGINKAKQAGISFGRRKALTLQQVSELRAKRQTHVLVKDLMKEYSLSEASIYRYLNANQV